MTSAAPATTSLADKLLSAGVAGVDSAKFDPGFHPENTPANADKFGVKTKKLEKGPNGPGLNDKGPFKNLDKTWREKFEAAKDEELRAEASKIGLNEVANQTLKAADLDLAAKRAAASDAAQQYTDATKANKLKVQYIRHLLESRGKEPAAKDLGIQSKT
jgi:hypothetical protein